MKRSWRVPLGIGLCVGLLVWLVSGTDPMRDAEHFLLDARYVWRWKPAPSDPGICVVTTTDETHRELPEHPVTWLGHYARVSRAALEHGATVVGIDFLLRYMDPEGFPPMAQLALERRGQLVLIAYLDNHGLTAPMDPLLAVLGADHVALANLTRDEDGRARAQMIYPLERSELGRDSLPFLAGFLAERHTGQRLDPSNRTFGGQPVPAMGPNDPRLLVNYVADSGTAFPTYPLHQVLQHLEDEDWLEKAFRGRAVLLGSGAGVDQDLCDTPFSLERHRVAGPTGVVEVRSSMFGVFYHANVLNTLLTRSFL
ncbi:MAG: CHASE2 domain-containing protein, partial [Candidatus Eremiobacterota bacterium]